MATKKSCAYCGRAGPFTREHIWPKCIIKRTNYKVRYSMKANQTFLGEQTIRDVCALCNNGPLSMLDDYVCSLFDKYFSKIPKPVGKISFQYDHQKLLRWLLKISYNSSRSTGINVHTFKAYALVLIADVPVSPIHAIAFVSTANQEKSLISEQVKEFV